MSETDDQTEQRPDSSDLKKASKATRSKGGAKPGRPPHPVPMEQHSVAMPADLWQWAKDEPEGPGALVRNLLERERIRRSNAFYEIHMAGGPQFIEVKTPWGGVTVLEIPGRGVILLRDDDQAHSVGYVADENGWRYSFSENTMTGLVLSHPHQASATKDNTSVALEGTGGTGDT